MKLKYTQKTKYFVFGALATAVLAPLVIYAVETIPVTFGEGDVISASVMNNVLKRVNDTQRGFSSGDEIIGTWACTTYTVRTDCTNDFALTTAGQLYKKTQNVIFSKSGNTYSISADWNPGNCTSTGPNTKTSDFEMFGTKLTSFGGIQEIQKLSPYKFVWGINSGISGGGVNSYAVCEKASQPPAPADALSATVSGSSVALAWTDQSSDETGFKVQYKTSAKGSWTTATTTAANATSYTLSGLSAATYWIRVIATNGSGDAISSSEVQAVVQ